MRVLVSPGGRSGCQKLLPPPGRHRLLSDPFSAKPSPPPNTPSEQAPEPWASEPLRVRPVLLLPPRRRGPVAPSLSRETCALFPSSRSPEWGGNVSSCRKHRSCSWSCSGLFYLAVTSSLSEPGSAWRSPERPALGTRSGSLPLCVSG